MPPRTLIAWLDDYFEVVARAIHTRGGEILKLIGDAALAVWPVDAAHPAEATCRAALAGAHDANRALDDLNSARAALRVSVGRRQSPRDPGFPM